MLCVCVFIFSILKVFVWGQENNKTSKIKDDGAQSVVERKAKENRTTNFNPLSDKKDDYWDYIKMDMLSADFVALKKRNSDTVGFIKVNGTNINYPVVQTIDNDFYLNHAFDKSKNSAGWVFADYRNNMIAFDKNTIIYAHGRLNNTIIGRSKKKFNTSLDINDKILTLSTCKDVSGKERVVMHAKLIKVEKRG